MSDVDEYRAKADEYSRQLQEAQTPEARERLSRMEQSYRLLARNAEWLRATDTFVKDMRARPMRPPRRDDRTIPTSAAVAVARPAIPSDLSPRPASIPGR